MKKILEQFCQHNDNSEVNHQLKFKIWDVNKPFKKDIKVLGSKLGQSNLVLIDSCVTISIYKLFQSQTTPRSESNLQQINFKVILCLKRQDRVGILTQDLPNCRSLRCKQRRLSDLILFYNSKKLCSSCQQEKLELQTNGHKLQHKMNCFQNQI